MSVKFFLVDRHAPTLQLMARALQGLGTVRCVAPDDLERLPRDGAFGVVCLGPGADAELAQRVAARAPGCLRLACLDGTDVEQVHAMMGPGTVDRILPWPAAPDAPGKAEVLERFAQRVRGEVEAAEGVRRRAGLLASFRMALEQPQGLVSLAERTAETLFEALEGAAVLVQLWDPEGLEADGVCPSGDRGQHWFEASRGGEMSSELFSLSLTRGDLAVGEVVVDLGATSRTQSVALVEAVGASLSLAAGAALRQRESDRAMHALMAAVAGLAGGREHVGNRHVERIGGYVRLIAAGLREDGHFVEQLGDDEIDAFVRAVALHDIGKLAVPDAILLKPAQLSSAERRVVEGHASAGGAALDEALAVGGAPHFLTLARDAARDHHEKWDGTGYPRGMAGDHIPLIARIVALADIYDALTTRRPFREAWSHAEAIETITGLSGGHLDPRVVESFLRRADGANALRDRLRDEEPEPSPHAFAA